MHRERIHTFKGFMITADVAEALRLLEASASQKGWRVKYTIPDRPSGHLPLSLLLAGREVHFTFEKDGADAQAALHAAWGCAVPLGFTPKLRHPLVESGFEVYHFYGPWQGVHGKMMAEGRGHLAFSSLCCAAQVDVGVWSGDKEEARFVQAQLHRIGRNPGPVDGVVGQRTAAAIESLNLPRASLAVVAEHLRTAQAPPKQPKQRGHVLIPHRQVVARGFGGVKVWPMDNGAGLQVDGPGRLVVDVR
jgi:hypothetical protein